MEDNSTGDKPTKSPEEIRRLKLEMAKISRLFSGLRNLCVVPGDG